MTPTRAVPLGSAPLGVCLIAGHRSSTQRSMAAWSRSAARRPGALHTPAQPMAQQRPHPGRVVADAGQPLDHDGDAVKGPKLPGEPVGAGAFQQRLLDLVASWASDSLGAGPLGPRLRSASVPPACQRACQMLTPGRETSSWRATSAWRDAGGEQLGRAQPAGLEAVAFSLCRRAARDSWHAPDPHPQDQQGSNSTLTPSTRHPSPFSGSLLTTVAGRGGVAGLRRARQAAVAAAGAAALATTTASSAPARSMGSARPAPPATPPATSR